MNKSFANSGFQEATRCVVVHAGQQPSAWPRHDAGKHQPEKRQRHNWRIAKISTQLCRGSFPMDPCGRLVQHWARNTSLASRRSRRSVAHRTSATRINVEAELSSWIASTNRPWMATGLQQRSPLLTSHTFGSEFQRVKSTFENRQSLAVRPIRIRSTRPQRPSMLSWLSHP